MLKTKIAKVHTQKPASKIIEEAAKIIREGGLVVYPTESAYALGCNALDEAAVRKVFAVKTRPLATPIPIIVSNLTMWKTCAKVDDKAEKLAKKFWPGPLTIALRKKPIVPDTLNPKTVAARISGHPIAQLVVEKAAVPITATSANTSGRPAHYTVKQVLKDLHGKVDLVLDAGRLPRRKLSTIVDFTLGSIPKISRVGAIPQKRISEILPVEVAAE